MGVMTSDWLGCGLPRRDRALNGQPQSMMAHRTQGDAGGGGVSPVGRER